MEESKQTTSTTDRFRSLLDIVKMNISDYFMFFALVVIMIFFTITTDGVFISSRNISNLINQMGYIAVLAVGMTLIIVIRHIELSVGYLAGFLGAFAAIAMTFWGWPVFAVIPAVMVLGMLAGMLTATPVAKLGVPAFVSTMAAGLIYRGALLLVTMGTGTIVIRDPIFNAIGNGFIPDLPFLSGFLPGRHKLTLIFGLIAIIWYIISAIRGRKTKQSYNFAVPNTGLFILQLVIISALIGYIAWILSGYNGISWSLVILLLVVLVFQFITTKTPLGRHIYAVGGNPEAAELSGISVSKITYIVFGAMGLLSSLSGIMYASRLRSATTTAGLGFETDAIAAAFVGGVSAAGGVGTIIGSIIGALVMMSLTSGMNLMGIDISIQYIVRGLVLVLAVVFDRITRRNR
ncbi:MAG: sugar ABC transporter permease [Anaerolineaceae bacterium]|jgi:putative multiple sugar transport system permease protein|nr:sugar ABC transporter permease [Anaerolineaceae bacterium]MDD4042762.1 sugar ABC transporter permease [Anaerolineaceae bacterium]MDD4578119.1 sugar ABC transporter permease [Anaerolineaceae bacterium]